MTQIFCLEDTNYVLSLWQHACEFCIFFINSTKFPCPTDPVNKNYW